VVVYLLSNPGELAHLNEHQDRLGKLARTLAWRMLSTIRQEDRASHFSDAGNLPNLPSPGDENLLADVEQEGYSMDVIGKYELSKDDAESSETEAPADEFDFESIPSEGPSPDILRQIEEEHFAGRDLMGVLGKAISEEALQLLVARYVDGQSVGEIAKQRGISELQVVRLLNTTRDLARRTLGPFMAPRVGAKS